MGDLVYVRDESRKIGVAEKLQNKFKGPYKIIEEILDGINLVLKSVSKGDQKIIIHISEVKQFDSYNPEVEDSRRDYLRRKPLIKSMVKT